MAIRNELFAPPQQSHVGGVLVLLGGLLLDHLLHEARQVLLEGGEDELGVLSRTLELLELLHAARCHARLGAVRVVVVDNAEAEGRCNAQGHREALHELLEVLFGADVGRVDDKDDSLHVGLDGGPTLLVPEVAGNIPELDVDPPHFADAGGRIALEIDDAAADRGTVLGARTLLQVTKDVGNGALA